MKDKTRKYQTSTMSEHRLADGWIVNSKYPLSKALETFAKQNLKLKGETVISVETIIDPVKDTVVFRLIIKD